MSNISLFKRYDRAQDAMARATMPKAADATDALALVAKVAELVAARADGSRLVKAVAHAA